MLDLTGLTELVAQRGLDSSLKADGSDLSGGQKQRIELARALLQDRQVLLVDEGTSALGDMGKISMDACAIDRRTV